MPSASASQPRLKPSLSQRKSILLLLAQNDVRLVAKVRAGSKPAFEALFRRHSNRLLSYTRHMLGDQHEAEEAVQQTFLKAYGSLRSSDQDIKFKPWAYRIAHNQCISMLRAKSPKPPMPKDQMDEPDTRGLSEDVENREELRAMLKDLESIPSDQRTALLLTELEALSTGEIAEVIGCDRDKVKSLVYMARTSLADSRKARETGCEEIRRQLSVLRGGSLRRKVIRNHLRQCMGCREFRDEVKLQRAALSVVLPVTPMFVLAKGGFVGSALASTGGAWSGGATGAAGVATGASGAGSAGAGVAAVVAGKMGTSALVVKAVAVVAAAGAVAGGAVAVDKTGVLGGSKTVEPTSAPSSSKQPATDRTEGQSGGQSSSKDRSSSKKKKSEKDKDDAGSTAGSEASSGAGSGAAGQGTSGSNAGSNGAAQSKGSQSSKATGGGKAKAKGKGKSKGQAKGKTTAPGQTKTKAPPPGQAKDKGGGSDNAAIGKGQK